MDDLNLLIESIPVKQDLVSSFVFSGILVAILTIIIIFARSDAKHPGFRLFGYLLLVEVLIGIDGFLCYTGLMKHTLFLNDITEPLVFLIGPLLYLLIRGLVNKVSFSFKWDILHFVPALLYTITQVVYYVTPLAYKYNAYTDAYHPDLATFELAYSNLFIYSDHVKSFLRWFIILSLLFYILLSIKVYFQNSNKIKRNNQEKVNRVSFSRNLIILVAVAFLVIFIIFLNFENDLGDHYISVFFTICNFLAAGFIMSESRFFDKSWVADKYETSGMKSVPEGMFIKIDKYVQDQAYFLNSNTSLSDLSTKLKIPSNYISQAINKEKGVNFNDYINGYRVEEAKIRLHAEEFKHYNIESIGESVGFNAKSTFYAAFKKQTGLTPSVYLKSL